MLLLIGTPLMYLRFGPAIRVREGLDHPLTVVLLLAASMLVLGLLNVALASASALLAAVLFRRRDPSEPAVAFRSRASFWRPFAALFLMGFLGILSLPLSLADQIRALPVPPYLQDVPQSGLLALALVNPILFLAIGVALGIRLAPRIGLRSYLVDKVRTGTAVGPRLRRDAPLAIACGAGVSVLVILLDSWFRPYLGEAWRQLEQEQPWRVTDLVTGLLYGGITEEIMLHWGAMTLFTWIGWRFLQRSPGTPKPAILWTAAALSALLFGIGHLPAVASVVPLSGVIVARTVLLNATAGGVFGWLYWRRSLEAAMLAHASAHVVFALAPWTGGL